VGGTMKIARRIRQFKPLITFLCDEFSLPEPDSVKVMSNYFGRPEVSWGRFVSGHSTSNYEMKIRYFKFDANHELIKRDDEEIIETICHELAHSVHRNHSPQHYALTQDLKKRGQQIWNGIRK